MFNSFFKKPDDVKRQGEEFTKAEAERSGIFTEDAISFEDVLADQELTPSTTKPRGPTNESKRLRS